MQLLIIFITYTIISLILTYYFHLFISQTIYTRNEIRDIIPHLGNMLWKIYNRFSVFILTGLYSLSGLVSIMILSIFENWIINSALLPIIVYMVGPRLAIYFEQTRVMISDDYHYLFQTLYTKYYNYILAGFFAGFSTQLIDNWINKNIISFYWFLLNFAIITGLLVITFRNDIFET